jgi:hypothetical protein
MHFFKNAQKTVECLPKKEDTFYNVLQNCGKYCPTPNTAARLFKETATATTQLTEASRCQPKRGQQPLIPLVSQRNRLLETTP